MTYRRRLARLALSLVAAAAVVLGGGTAAHADASWDLGFDNAPGYSHHENLGSHLCLASPSTQPGAAVVEATCHNGADQEWKGTVATTITDHRTGSCMCTYQVSTIANHLSGLCLALPDGTVTDGTPIIQSPCTPNSSYQQWRALVGQLLQAPNGDYLATYDLKVEAGGQCLDVPGGSTTSGQPMQIWDCLNNLNQNWLIG